MDEQATEIKKEEAKPTATAEVNNEVKTEEPTKQMSSDAAEQSKPVETVKKPKTVKKKNSELSTDAAEKKEDAVKTPDEEDPKEMTAIKVLAKQYDVIAHEFASRFSNNPDDAEKLADFAMKVFKSPKWVEWLNGKEKSRAIIQNKIIPTLVKAYNAKNKGSQIELPKQVNDDTTEALKDRNGNDSVASLVIPEGFNKELVELGDQAISADIGYPMVNFNSQLIKEIVRESDKSRLKKLLRALIKKLEGTPAAEVFLKRGFLGAIKASLLYKLIDQAKDAKGVPMIRRPLKVPSQDLVGDSESTFVSVIPVNNLGNEFKDPSKIESVNMSDLTPLYESYQNAQELEALYENWFNGKIDTTSKAKYGAPVDIPKVYLQQYYTVLLPTGASGLTKYASYITKEDKEAMIEKLDKEDVEAIKSSNRNVNDALISAYLQKTNGVPPFYILTARTNPTKERLRVCDEIKLGKNICIKSLDGKNKDAYYIPEDVANSIFEAG